MSTSMPTDVSSTKELRKGFVQAVYNKENTKTMVLLFDIAQGAELPNHRHAHHQFGYTFRGEYDFVIDGRTYLAHGGQSYHIAGGIFHSAVALTDYYSMDFKYIGAADLEQPISFDVIRPAGGDGEKRGEIWFGDTSGPIPVRKLAGGTVYRFPSVPADAGRERLLVVSADTGVEIDGERHALSRMKIYRLDGTESLSIRIEDAKCEAFLYEM